MTNDEAERLARRVLCAHPDSMHPTWMSMGALSDAAMKLANYIVSGDMKREIENAAFERAAEHMDKRADNYRDTANSVKDDTEIIPLLEASATASENGAETLRALIQPAAQPGDKP